MKKICATVLLLLVIMSAVIITGCSDPAKSIPYGIYQCDSPYIKVISAETGRPAQEIEIDGKIHRAIGDVTVDGAICFYEPVSGDFETSATFDTVSDKFNLLGKYFFKLNNDGNELVLTDSEDSSKEYTLTKRENVTVPVTEGEPTTEGTTEPETIVFEQYKHLQEYKSE